MIQKINRLVETVVKGFVGTSDLECVQRIPYHGGGLPDSPLFCLKADVIFRGSIPPFPDRLQFLSRPQFVETSLSREKDRFFLEDMPVHLNYKQVSMIDQELAALGNPRASHLDTTYGLFRLNHGIPAYEKSPWLKAVKAKLQTLPESFWAFQRNNLSGRLEHLLSDLAAAVFNQDPLFFQISLASFLQTLAELLFALSRQFVCPPEELKFQLDGLGTLPPGFTGYFDSLIRDDGEFDHDRRLALARHLAESVLANS